MKPNRPGSASSKYTKITQDSDNTKRQVNLMQMSQTSSSGSNSFIEENDPFKQYVAKKNQQQKFKKLESIPQKTKPREKPFQKKKTIEKVGKKIQQQPKKEDEPLNMSKGFAKVMKKKMDQLKNGHRQQQTREDKPIDLPGFTVTHRGKGSKKEMKTTLRKTNGQVKQVKQLNGTARQIKPAKPSLQSPKKQLQKSQSPIKVQQKQKKQQQQRNNKIKQLHRYVNKIEAHNQQCLTKQYDRMIQANPSNIQDLEKIDLNNFLQQPTQQGYELMVQKIQYFDKQSGSDQSIDLQEIINSGVQQKKQLQAPLITQQSVDQQYLDSISASQLVQRNAFITDILKGSKISKKQINELQEKERSAVRMHKLQREKTQQKNEDEVELPQINVVQRNTHRVIEKNKKQAGGHIYRDCDYLSEEHQKRLEELLEGDIGESPFDCDQLEKMKRRRIDQGIRMYRQMSSANNGQRQDILNQQSLPKDPQNRKKAEKRILSDKIKNVNERLSHVDRVPVTKQKVRSLIQQFQYTRHSQAYEQLFQQNKQRFEQNMQKLQQAEELLHSFQEKQNMNEIINDIEEQYRQLQRQIKILTETDAKELKKMEEERLRQKMRQLQRVQQQNNNFEGQIQKMQIARKQVQQSLRSFDQLQMVQLPQLQCQGYTQTQTIQDIDAVVTRKWQQSQQIQPSQKQTPTLSQVQTQS